MPAEDRYARDFTIDCVEKLPVREMARRTYLVYQAGRNIGAPPQGSAFLHTPCRRSSKL